MYELTLNTPYDREPWEVWYQDVFDREAPSRVEISGTGLANGLTELWARHLFETVQATGQEGFSRFSLPWRQGTITIQGDWEGAKRLRGWMFGEKDHSYHGYVAEADLTLLTKVAHAHLSLIGREQTSEPILALAAKTNDQANFVNQLEKLIKS